MAKNIAKQAGSYQKNIISHTRRITHSISLHFYFALLLFAFPTGDAPAFVTCKGKELVMVAAGPAGAQCH